jgi:REP element-mobilizing transposase RayT
MPRRPRTFAEDIYHIGAHGSDDRLLFLNDGDRDDFLDRLASVWKQFELELQCYALLGNHYHTIARIPDARVSRALQRLHTEYSRNHNRRHGRHAQLFRAHPFAREIQSDAADATSLIDVSAQTLSEWKRGKSPHLSMLLRVAEFLEIHWDRLVNAPFTELLTNELLRCRPLRARRAQDSGSPDDPEGHRFGEAG